MMILLVFASMILPGVVLVVKRGEFANQALLGLAAGASPLLASAAWAVYFIARYHGGYSLDEMQLMEGHQMGHYAICAIAVPLFANLVWRKCAKPSLMKERLVLIAGFVAGSVLTENMPPTWSFTFVLFPFAFFLLLIGFLFIKRPRPDAPESAAGRHS